jgi:DNA-binding transcriptional LysR family regulator
MDIESIRTFHIVAQYKSFQKAADILLLTQSGVSKRIQNLENELGHPLFIRSHQAVSLSKYGEEYLPYAKRMLKIHEDWLVAMKNVKDDALKIAIPFSMNRFFPDIFYNFLKKESIPIRVYGANSNEIYEMLIDQTIDLGITSAVFPSPQIKYELIYSEKMCCVASPAIISRYMKADEITNAPMPFVMCKMHNFRAHPWDTMLESIRTNESLRIVCTVNFFELARSLAKKGLGATTLPYTEVSKELESGELLEASVRGIVLPMRSTYLAVNKQVESTTNKYLIDLVAQINSYCKKLETNI